MPKKKKNIRINKADRPLSPHLTIYKPQITSVLSITHRMTGLFMIAGAIYLSWWIISLSGTSSTHQCFAEFNSSIFGNLLLIAWTFSIFYHLCNGIRHLFWDMGYGFELSTARASGWTVVVVSIMLTLIIWHAAIDEVVR